MNLFLYFLLSLLCLLPIVPAVRMMREDTRRYGIYRTAISQCIHPDHIEAERRAWRSYNRKLIWAVICGVVLSGIAFLVLNNYWYFTD